MSVNPTMMLITSLWQGKKAFKLMPIANDCAFNEGIFDPESKVLVMMSTQKKESVHMMPRLDENGDPMKSKTPRPNGKTYKEHRVHLETYTEHYIVEKEDIENIIKMLAINADTFEYKKYLVPSDIIMPEEKKIEIVKA